ncbi:MAG: phosphopantothenoylcysteine decarboxylase [Candidatus Omnitrophota bacterium]
MRVLVTAGPTREWLDPVRFISNPASGRLGYLLAAEGVRRGAEVILVSGPANLPVPDGVRFIKVESAVQMAEETLKIFPRINVLFMTAAVSDWRPRFRMDKIKRKEKFSLTLFPNPDILGTCGKIKKPDQILIGCALETRGLIEAGRKKLREKKIDFILVNNPSFFGKEKGRHSSFLLSRKGEVCDLSAKSKEDISRFLYERCLLICSSPSSLLS